MLIQSSLPSSIEVVLSFVSDHGKEDFLCDWMPGAETWQMCPKCDEDPQGGCRNGTSTEEKKNTDDLSSNLPISCSQLSTVITMTESSTPNFVYRRRKHQKNSIAMFTSQASARTKASGGCHSALSSESPSIAAKEEHLGSQIEHETEVVGASVMPTVMRNGEPLVFKSESINGFSVGVDHGCDEAPKHSMHKIVEFCSVNDSCSSSKSNMEIGSASMKTEVDDNGECSSSDLLVMEVMGEDLSEKDLCISILRSQGLLKGVWPVRTHASAVSGGISSDSSCSRSCKVCGHSETTLSMLICDHCEEAFHVSCCNPRLKRIPIDEWFCHPCLKKTRKILKETTTSISSETGSRCMESKGDLSHIAFMLKDTEPYITGVRIGKAFQAEIPNWSGPITNDIDSIGEPLEMDPSECVSLHEWNSKKPSRLSSIGNWLQCREVIDGVGEGIDGTICGKWRRAPLFEVQTDDWDCFRSVFWDPTHSDCAVPQELETDQVLKQLKYIGMLRPRLAAKRRKLSCTESGGSQDPTEDVKNIRTPL
ncbi:hypothetical protein L1049_001502 [Liquidambar formosana]|uniref:Uncharacterized protein n=1 Tax=Liquidambar formosana TaxID=63359 RepID=A0AAP0NED5_LIQFO